MANPQRGEVSVTVMGSAWVLRPSFDRLCRIEKRLLKTIASISQSLAGDGLACHELVAILAIASDRDEENILDQKLHAIDFNKMLPAISEFLKAALPLGDWQVMCEVAFLSFGIVPKDFWEMTPMEFRILLRAKRNQQRKLATQNPTPEWDEIEAAFGSQIA